MKKTINFAIFFVLTFINFSLGLYLTKFEQILTIIVLFICFIANQLMLLDGARNLIEDDGNKKRAILFLSGKFFVLIFAFWYATRKNEAYIYIFIGNYIFQLIILGLSIKNDTKKMMKE